MICRAFQYSGINSFSTNWPYSTCTGYGNYLILVNAFDQKFIQRIQLADDSQKITVCDTYITDTYDLFVLIQEKETFRLYMVDLDAANEGEQDEEEEEVVTYMIGEPIYSYTSKQVENRQFLNMYVRGSSRKEEYDRNEKLFVYFLHEGSLYSWSQLTKFSRFDELNFVSPCSSSDLLPVSHGNFIYLQESHDQMGRLEG